MIHHLDENGTMAIILPHGVLFRGAAEGHIRRYLIEDRNYLDAVIGLPPNIFFGTGIPTCILVFKKCRENPDDILFIDASSEDYFEKAKNKNALRSKDIDRIVESYAAREFKDKFSYLAPLSEVAENDYNLNIPRYVDTFEPEPEVDLAEVIAALRQIELDMAEVDKRIAGFCDELGIQAPVGTNGPLLKLFKKGIADKIFSQSFRFKSDDGSLFPSWEIKKLRQLASRSTEKNKDDAIERVLTNSAIRGVVDQGEYFDKDIANANNLDGYYIVRDGDFVYNPRISVSAPVGPIKRNHVGDGVMSPLYTVFRFNDPNPKIYEQYFATTHWHKYMKSVANFGARHDRMNITVDDFLDIPLPVPHPDEQKKISNFLFALDDKINFVTTQTGLFE